MLENLKATLLLAKRRRSVEDLNALILAVETYIPAAIGDPTKVDFRPAPRIFRGNDHAEWAKENA